MFEFRIIHIRVCFCPQSSGCCMLRFMLWTLNTHDDTSRSHTTRTTVCGFKSFTFMTFEDIYSRHWRPTICPPVKLQFVIGRWRRRRWRLWSVAASVEPSIKFQFECQRPTKSLSGALWSCGDLTYASARANDGRVPKGMRYIKVENRTAEKKSLLLQCLYRGTDGTINTTHSQRYFQKKRNVNQDHKARSDVVEYESGLWDFERFLGLAATVFHF